jgi:malonate transporter and related proteins
MQSVINIVLPVFAIILSGYLAGSLKLLGGGSGEVLQRFVFYIAMPVLLFYAMARVEVAEILNWPYLSAYLGGQTITFVLALIVAKFLLKKQLAESALSSMAGIYGNTGYMGIPLVMAAFGSDWLVPAIIATVVNAAIVLGIVAAIIETKLSVSDNISGVLKDVVNAFARNPLLISPILGFCWSLSGLGLVAPVETFCSILGAAAGPCALFSVGLFLVGKSLHQNSLEVSWIVSLKLFVQPAITWALAFHVLELDVMWATICVIMAALPTGANIFILARHYDLYLDQASAVILISTITSLLGLSFLFSHWSNHLFF